MASVEGSGMVAVERTLSSWKKPGPVISSGICQSKFKRTVCPKNALRFTLAVNAPVSSTEVWIGAVRMLKLARLAPPPEISIFTSKVRFRLQAPQNSISSQAPL